MGLSSLFLYISFLLNAVHCQSLGLVNGSSRSNVEWKDLSKVPQNQGNIWPKPTWEARDANTLYSLDPKQFRFIHDTSDDWDIIPAALKRYRSITFPDDSYKLRQSYLEVRALTIEVSNPDDDLELDTDEGYTLFISAPTSRLKAQTIWGALRGLESFSQLVFENGTSYLIYRTTVKDYPRFKFRGFLIDTSRHYLPKQTIYQFLDGMSYSKLNVLHWHIVDDNSFPFVSKKFPELHLKGAYDPQSHIYTPADVRDIIQYARNRGIRVMPEFDTPGHTHSWGAISGILTDCGNVKRPDEIFQDKKGPLNPIKEKTYQFLKEFFKEIAAVFPDKYLHLGGDEVDTTCWESNQEILDWLSKSQTTGNGNSARLHTVYMNRLISIVDRLNKNYVVWQDVFDEGANIDKSTIVEVWKGDWQSKLSDVTSKGHKAILAACWYLDLIQYGLDWPAMYSCDPQNFTGTDDQKSLVLGGSAAIWGEFVDATNIMQRSFGRAFAVAERLWSRQNVVNSEDALKRMWEHQCRYLRRGIPAEPISKGHYCLHEWDPVTAAKIRAP